jgi:hypothetical protein
VASRFDGRNGPSLLQEAQQCIPDANKAAFRSALERAGIMVLTHRPARLRIAGDSALRVQVRTPVCFVVVASATRSGGPDVV